MDAKLLSDLFSCIDGVGLCVQWSEHGTGGQEDAGWNSISST